MSAGSSIISLIQSNQDMEQFRKLSWTGTFEDYLDKDGLELMTGGGFVEMDETGLRATATGRLCLNEVLRHLLAP